VEVVHAGNQLRAGDFAAYRREIDLAWRAFHQKIYRLANDPPRAIGDENRDR